MLDAATSAFRMEELDGPDAPSDAHEARATDALSSRICANLLRATRFFKPILTIFFGGRHKRDGEAPQASRSSA